MSQHRPHHRLRRPVLFALGVAALLSGLAWSATAATNWLTGPSDDSAPKLVAASEVDPGVKAVTDGVISWLGLTDTLSDDEKAAAQNAVFGAKEYLASRYPDLFASVDQLTAELDTASREDGTTIAKLDQRLDDLDGDGDPASDVHGIDGVTVDLQGDITPQTGTGPFDVKLSLKVKVAGDSPLAMLLDGVKINGQQAKDALGIDVATTVHVDPAGARRISIPVPANPVGTLRTSVDRTFDGAQNPLAFQVGVLGVKATGSVKADAGVSLRLHDPNGDGVIDESELASPGSLFDLGCVSEGAKVDLAVTTDLAGLTGKVGTIKLDDGSLCNGLAAPDLQLGDLGQFRNLTLGDVVNGLAQVTRSLSAAQAAGDLDLPFVQEPLRDLVSANEKLVAFFVDNGFTDPANPMASISVDTADTAAVKTVQDLAPKLATALGMSPEALNFRYDNGRALLTVRTGHSSGPQTTTLDLADTLSGVGITEVTGRATATVTPSYSLDFGVGMDLSAAKTFDQRFFLTNGTGGSIATLDAPVSADVDVQAIASAIGVELKDAASGPVTLLKRKDGSKPMLSVALTDPNADGRVTLAELSATGALPVKPTFNASVPKTDLTATAQIAGVPLGSGSVSLAWTSVPDPATFTVTGSQDFLDTTLPFSFDTSDPQALVAQVLTVTRDTVTKIRTAVASGNATTTKPLPLVGRSVADLDPVLQKIQGALDEIIQANDLTDLEALQAKLDEVIAKALGETDGMVPDVVRLSYEKKTATTPATLVVRLALGACSTDRAEGRDGCTVTGAPLDVPFNLDLGSGSKAGGIAGVGASGSVKVGYDARANLTFGVQLPSVTAAGPGQLPKVSGAPTLFVQDDSKVDLGVGAEVDGVVNAGLGPVQVSLGSAGDHAKAAVAARFKLAAPNATGQRLTVGSSAFDTWVASLLPKAGSVNVHETDSALAATCPGVTGTVDACAALPVYVGTTSLGTVTFKAPDLLTPSGWSVDSAAVEASLHNEAIQWALIVDGVRTLTHQVSDGLRSMPTGTKIPLIGADVTAGADVLDKFDTAVLGKVQTLSDTLANNAPTAGSAKAKAEQILGTIDGLPSGSTPTVTVTCRTDDGKIVVCEGSEPISRLQSFEVQVPLHYGVDGGTSAFDIGFPGLRLASSGEVRGSAGIDVRLGFGVDRDLGFYVPTTGTTPEFAVTAKASLPNVAGGPDLTGDLAFFPIAIEDHHAGDDVTVSAGVDLSTSRSDGRLPLADLGRAELTPKLNASSAVHLGITTEKPQGAASALPVFGADLDLDASVTWTGSAGSTPTTNASIAFNNVTVDAGSLVGDFLKPVVRTLHGYTAPLEKPIDAIRKPIPGVADAAKLTGRTAPTWYDAFKAADQAANGDKSTGLQMIDRIILLVDLTRALDNPDRPSGQIPIGNFTVLPKVASQPVPLNDADKLLATTNAASGSVLDKVQFTGSDKLKEAQQKGGFTFPAFDKPSSLFGMLLGKDVPLVYFDAGTLKAQRGFQFSYPIGPAKLYIGGSAGVSGHLAAGFDTYGLRKAFEVLTDDDPKNDGAWSVTKGLLQGLYLDDFDQQGNDVPEIRFDAELTAGASVGIPGLEAGAEGGVQGTAEFNLRADTTGKLRYTDIAQQLKVNPNPLCFFDASARIDAFIRAYVDSPLGKAEYPIVSARVYDQPNLFEFCNTPQAEHENVLAALGEDGKLVFNTDTAPQSITVTQTGPSTVEVAAQGLVETYQPVTSMFADLQGGDDVMDVRADPSVAAGAELPATVCGGAGNDRIMVSSGNARLYGDSGPGCLAVSAAAGGSDSLSSGDGADVLDGGPGSDALDGAAGGDTLSGGSGDDVLRGGTDNDALDGGVGSDTTDYGDHTTPVTISLPGPSGSAGESDAATDVENIYGGSAADDITVPADGSVRVDSGTGDDTVHAGGATALLMGNEGNDTFLGGTGSAQVVGSDGDDTLVDGPGAQTFLGLGGRDTVDYSALTAPVRVVLDGEPGDGPIGSGLGLGLDNVIDTDVVIGTAQDDQLTGGSGAEELRGLGGADDLEGGPGADVLDAGPGDDDLDGDAGDDRLLGGANADRLHGAAGADDFAGGEGSDWADYTDRTEALTITKDDAASDGSATDSWKDNVHTDVERIATGSGNDNVTGYPGADVLEGNGGNDRLSGNGGEDHFDGATGNDELYDLDVNRRLATDGDDAADTYVGADGIDWAYGNGGADTFDLGTGGDYAYAGPGVDTIAGGDGDDQLHGGAGNDTIRGEKGDDNMWGEDGDDQLDSGESTVGNSSVWGGLGEDTIRNGSNGGNVYTGIGGVTQEQDTSRNTVYGFAGVGSYTGGLGDDTFILGVGDDTVHGAAGNDHIELGAGKDNGQGDAGDDTVIGGDGDDQLFGGVGDDVLRGVAGRDMLVGDAGADTLVGGADDDTLDGNDGDDVLDGGANSDVLNGEGGVDTVSYADRTTAVVVKEDGNSTDGGVEDKSSRTGYEKYFDHVDDDVEHIVGGSGDDSFSIGSTFRVDPAVLEGGPGKDTLVTRSSVPTTFVGGPGDDVLTGGGGADRFDQGSAPDGADDMYGGGGADAVDYGGRPAGSATVSLDDVANDGAVDEHDNVHADVESAPGAGTGASEDPITFTVDPVTVTEGGPGAHTAATFTIRLGAPAPRPTTLDWAVTGQSATVGSDFVAGSGQVTVAQGATTATFAVTVLGDGVVEPDETAQVTVTRGGGSAPASATLTIADDDVPPVSPSVASVRVAEGAAGARTPATFTVRLAAPAAQPVSFAWTVAGRTATVGSDVAAGQGQVTIAQGQSTASFTVTVLGDNAVEPDETAAVTVTGGGASVTATLTVANDDKPAPPPVVVPTVTIRSASLKEPDKGTRAMRFTIVLSKATSRSVTVRFATAGGTAKQGKDFVATSGAVTFAPGQTVRTVTVKVKGDRVKEKNEKFLLRLTGVTNGRAGASGTGTIRNDD